jgi:hypothetical protein
VQWIVAPTVVVVTTESLAHLEAKVWRDGDVSRIEKPMKVRSKQQPVPDIVWTIVGIRPDVGSLEGGEGMFFSDCTRASIRVEDGDAKRGLSKTGLHEARIAVAAAVLRDHERGIGSPRARWLGGADEAGLPNALPLAGIQIVFDGHLGSGLPVGGLGNPVGGREEDG